VNLGSGEEVGTRALAEKVRKGRYAGELVWVRGIRTGNEAGLATWRGGGVVLGGGERGVGGGVEAAVEWLRGRGRGNRGGDILGLWIPGAGDCPFAFSEKTSFSELRAVGSSFPVRSKGS